MKRLYIVLLFLNLISLFFIMQIVFYFFPLVNSNLPVDKINDINNLVTDISICIITSSFFYYLLVYIPERQKKNNVLKILNPLLSSISRNLFFILFFTYSNSKSKYLVSIDDFRKLSTWESLKTKPINHKLLKEIAPMVNELKDKTNNIFNNSLSTYLDDEILQRLSDASNSSFVTNITLCDLDEEYLTLLNLTGIIDIFNLYKQISNQKEYEIENDLLKLLIKPA